MGLFGCGSLPQKPRGCATEEGLGGPNRGPNGWGLDTPLAPKCPPKAGGTRTRPLRGPEGSSSVLHACRLQCTVPGAPHDPVCAPPPPPHVVCLAHGVLPCAPDRHCTVFTGTRCKARAVPSPPAAHSTQCPGGAQHTGACLPGAPARNAPARSRSALHAPPVQSARRAQVPSADGAQNALSSRFVCAPPPAAAQRTALGTWHAPSLRARTEK